MNKTSSWRRFLRFEGRLLLITVLLILAASCVSWKSFYRTPKEREIRRDFLIQDISSDLGFREQRLSEYDDVQLEIIEQLDLNGLIALERYPEQTVRLYEELKNFELFYDILNEYGPHHVIPVLDYFYDSGNISLTLQDNISGLISKFFRKDTMDVELSDRQKRLLMILGEIEYQKHNFLNRFVYTTDGAKRNYVTTTTSSIVNFFTGGLANFNSAVVTRGIRKVTRKELIDAGIDVVVLIPFAIYFTKTTRAAFSSLKGGSGAAKAAGRSMIADGATTAARTGGVVGASSGLLRAIPLRTLLKFKYVKWYLLGLVVIKPSLLNHAAAVVAKAVSVPPIAVKTGFWFLILFPFLNLLVPILFYFRYLWKKLVPRLIRHEQLA
jgi:hypothetical protein